MVIVMMEAFEHNGVLIDFDCEEMQFDLGDCDEFITDADGDGFDETVDCDDNDPSVNPGAFDIPNDGIDQNCDGEDSSSGDCSSFELLDCNNNYCSD